MPFHFVWLSLTILYGFRVWGLRATALVLRRSALVSTVLLGSMVLDGKMHPDELTEIPLMTAMFLAMVWHARRRQAALEEVRRAADREHDFVRDASHRLKTPIAISRGAHAAHARRARHESPRATTSRTSSTNCAA